MKKIQIIKKYNKLIEDVKTDDFYKVDLTNRVNCYRCSCGHITKTKDVDAGVTPFIIRCEECGSEAQSSFFKDIAPNQEPTLEWYRPSIEEVLKFRNNEEMLDHILKGGLAKRNINSK